MSSNALAAARAQLFDAQTAKKPLKLINAKNADLKAHKHEQLILGENNGTRNGCVQSIR